MKIPKSYNDITLGEYSQMGYLDTNVDTETYLKSFLKIFNPTSEIKSTHVYEMSKHLDFLKDQPKGQISDSITINNIEYGIYDDMNELTLGEMQSIETFIKSNAPTESLLAILLRPKIDGEIEKFNSSTKLLTSRMGIFKDNLSVVEGLGIMGFFLSGESVSKWILSTISQIKNQVENQK